MTSLLQTAMANLQTRSTSTNPASGMHQPTPRTPPRPTRTLERTASASASASDETTSEDEESEDEDAIVPVYTRPGTPAGKREGGTLSRGGSREGVARDARERVVASKDPLRMLPTALAVRVFLQLDVKTLARCDRVCKRWHKSSTLNYVWFLHTRSLELPSLTPTLDAQGRPPTHPLFDPYDKPRALSLRTPLPSSSTPQWSKRESKASWRGAFKIAATRPDGEEERDRLQVDVDALTPASGYSTPGHTYAGLGSGSRDAFAAASGIPVGGGSGTATPPRSKKEMREAYKAMGGRKAKEKGSAWNKGTGARDREGMGGREADADAPW